MRWRILPALNLEAISQSRCLLLGAGTLGCNVARCLMSWGVRNITFVDNGTVSYSNPVRQSLFEFLDCTEGGKPKAVAAAAKLKTIFPNMETQGHQFSIPMPGHAVTESELPFVKEAVQKMEELVKAHDVIFLLTDSRESRWLPTLLGVANDKLVINSALGFDTYLVMRHGAIPQGEEKKIEGERLGCYFCNDVVAPQDSQKDRTLDQQCTVTRPGLAYMASALAVELFVSVLHHPLRQHAPHDAPKELSDPGTTPLGTLPHQLRGFLTHFNALPLHGNAYSKCTACSETIVNEYNSRGIEFLLEVFNNPLYLEKITGLTQMANANVDIEWVEEGDDF